MGIDDEEIQKMLEQSRLAGESLLQREEARKRPYTQQPRVDWDNHGVITFRQLLHEVLSILFDWIKSRTFIFSMLLGTALTLAGFGLPFIIASMLVSLSASSILSYARRKLLERFYDPNANTANDHCYFELGQKGQDSWREYLTHAFAAPRSFLPFTQAGLAYQAGRRQKEFEEREEAEQTRAPQNRPH